MLNSGVSLQRLATKAGVGFTPKKLFSNGEAGVWYDPSDVEASLTWRRNLLEYTESFDNGFYDKGSNTVVTANHGVAPNGTQTADRLELPAQGSTYISGDATVTNGSVYTFSIYVKSTSGTSNFDLYYRFGGPSTQVGQQTATTEWQRFDYTVTASSTTGTFGVNNAGDTYASDILIWGAQLELGSTATEYQPIRSTFNNAFKQAFPKHTLYQDTDGIAPVTGLGQAVGIMLDKSQGLQFSEESVVNGTFDSNINGWTVPSGSASTITHSNGALSAVRNNEDVAVATLSSSVVAGKTYRLEFDVVSKSSENGWVYFVIGTNFTEQNTVYGKSLGKKIYTFVANNNTSDIYLRAGGVGGLSLVVDNISLKEVKGSHATQLDSTKRPVFARHPERGRVNLLKYTEEFDNGYWTKGGATTITANYSTAPDGTQTADRMVAPLAAGTYCVRSIPVTAGTNYVFSLYARATSGTDNIILSSPQVNTDFALDTNWKRISVTWTAPVTTNIDLTIDNGASAMDVLIWGAQVEKANEATGYQKVVDDYDITESGYKSVYYLQFDGINDCMSINSLTSGNTPLTALFGYSATNAETTRARLLFDIGVGRTIVGGSADTAGKIGYYDGLWREFEADADAIKVLTYDLVEDDAKIRINGTQEYSDTVYVQRAIGGQISLFSELTGTNNFLAGNLYQCVLRAAESTDKEIDQAEEFVAVKTGLKSEVVGLATLDLNFGANTYTARNSNGSVL